MLLRFDDEARAEMPCHLVVAELAMARTGDWLKTKASG
jgi:hypothetical protein